LSQKHTQDVICSSPVLRVPYPVLSTKLSMT